MGWFSWEASVTSLLVSLFVGSLATWGVIWQRTRRRAPLLPFQPRSDKRRTLFPVLVLFFLWNALRVALVLVLNPSAEISLETVKLNCLGNVLLLVLLPAAAYGMDVLQPPHAEFRFIRWRAQIGYGAVGFLAALAPVFLMNLATIRLGLRGPEHDKLHPFLKLLMDHPGAEAFLWIGLAGVVLAPLIEEFMFRFVIQGYLQTRMSSERAIVISSLLFAGVHQWPDPLPLFPLSLVLGYVYYRRNSFLAVVVLHGLFNGFNLLATFAATPRPSPTGSWLAGMLFG